MSAPKHFLHLEQVEKAELRRVLDDACALKRNGHGAPLAGKTLAMIFDKPSTRTRVSFEVAMTQLGGHAVLIDSQNSQLGRGETVGDTARVLSRYCDVIMIRTGPDAVLEELAAHATVPVINGLTDGGHPCQLMADVMTFEEHRGDISGRSVAWVGDGNNMAISWTRAAVQFGFELRLACPKPLAVPQGVVDWARDAGASVRVTEDPFEAVAGADCVVADTWVSMGDEPGDRHNLLQPFQVNGALMAQADKDAIFMHCLPAHRGEEVTAEVMDGPQSVVWDEAENRLHAQKAILSWCLEAA